MRKITCLIQQRFGKLVVIKYIRKDKYNQHFWLCKCDCGNEKIIRSGHIKSGSIKSCGCFQKERIIQGNKNRAGSKKKIKIIKKLDGNKVLCKCVNHGITPHYDYYGKCLICCLCNKERCKDYGKTPKGRKYKNISSKKRNQIPINNFASRLRKRIGSGLNRISNNNNRKIKGCFRNMNYSPLELYSYLENIRKLQDNCCPICKNSYNEYKMTIDHIIPLATAKTEQEVVDLFDLKNLNLMCKSCNSSKCKNDYSLWIKKLCL